MKESCVCGDRSFISELYRLLALLQRGKGCWELGTMKSMNLLGGRGEGSRIAQHWFKPDA
jgi:hypothetical protein